MIRALGSALKGSDRRLMITSGTGMGDAGDGRPATEAVFSQSHPNPRIASEQAAARLLDEGVNVAVMRLPQVHDTVRQGLISPYIDIARAKGVVGYVGAGDNRWPAAHVTDVAALYALAFDKGDAGVRYHAVAEQGISVRSIAEVVGRGLGMPVVSVPEADVAAHFGWFAGFVGLDMPASSAATRAQIGWLPTGPDLLTDLENMDYAVPSAQ